MLFFDWEKMQRKYIFIAIRVFKNVCEEQVSG